jgi:hypothetical protein
MVNLRTRICYLLGRLRIHDPDCEHCGFHAVCGSELRQRLEEVNWRVQPHSLKTGEPVGEPDSKLPEVVARPPKSA